MKRIFLLIVLSLLLIGTVSATELVFYPSGGTGAGDGYVQHAASNNTWTTIHDGVGTTSDNSSNTATVDSTAFTFTDRYTRISRATLIFDTSSLPDDAIITSAKISLRTQTPTATPDAGIGITKFNVDGGITTDDYDNFEDTRFATDQNISTTAWGVYSDWSLNSLGISNISLSGLCGFGVRTQWDIDDAMPWSSGANSAYTFRTNEYAASSPYLTVNYERPIITGFSASATSGVNPLSVTFTDSSTNSPTNWDWYWSADETKDSDDQNPTTTFTTGTYNIRLYTSHAGGGDWENKTAYIVVSPAATDIYIVSVSGVTNNAATFSVAGGLGGNVWVKYGQTPLGSTWKSNNVSAPAGTATVTISGSPLMTSTTYYAHACQAAGCNTSYSSFTTLAAGAITPTTYGSGFDNLTESNFNMFYIVPALLGAYTTVIPLNIFFGLILGIITLGMWVANKSTRLVSILFIICAPLLFAADSGLGVGIPGVMQALGEACLAIGIAGILLSLIRRG